MEENKMPRYAVATNGSKSYFQVVDNMPNPVWDRDMCTVYGKGKAERIADGLNLLNDLQSLSETSTKSQILKVIKGYLK